jgi:hypothetical protein
MQFVPSSENAKPKSQPRTSCHCGRTRSPQILGSQRRNDSEIRAKLEQAILNDLLGPAGGPEEEIDEMRVSDRYLVGLLAPQQRRIKPGRVQRSVRQKR